MPKVVKKQVLRGVCSSTGTDSCHVDGSDAYGGADE